MRVGIAIQDTGAFFHEIRTELAAHHQISSFTRRTVNTPFFYDRLNQRLYQRDLRNFLSTNDVVFFEWASELLADATQLPKTCGIVTRAHRYEIYHWADKVNWERVDKIILVSQAKQKEFAARFPGQAHKIVVIPEAVSLERFKFKQRPYQGNLGTMARLQPRKRIYELILAFYELIQENDGFHLHIGGSKRANFPEYFDILHDLVRRLKIEYQVTFYGDVKEPQDWYDQIDVFISNSYSEGLQVSPMEAIASGCYCLSHFWDGADELLPVENLYYTDRELIQKILNFHTLCQEEKQRKQADLLALVREKFDVDRTKVQIRQLVEEVGSRPGT